MGTGTVQINLRVPTDVADDLDMLAMGDHLTRIDVARQILLDGVAQRKQALALRLYREGKASKTRAAEIAGVSLWEMIDLIDQAGAPDDYTLAEAVEEIRRMLEGPVGSSGRRVSKIAEESPDELYRTDRQG